MAHAIIGIFQWIIDADKDGTAYCLIPESLMRAQVFFLQSMYQYCDNGSAMVLRVSSIIVDLLSQIVEKRIICQVDIVLIKRDS